VYLDAFIVRKLSGWDQDTERIISHLKLGHMYRYLIRKLMVLGTV
jgi:hypothetical protein